MKITQIHFSNGWGGAERHVVELCNELQKLGHKVQLICSPAFHSEHNKRLFALERVDTISTWNNWDYLALPALYRVIKAFSPAIIHTHLSRATWLGGISAKMCAIPGIATIHNQIKPKYLRFINDFICTTQAQQQHLASHHIADRKTRVIPNFSTFSHNTKCRETPATPSVFIAYGRFVPKKGFDLLIDAFAKVSSELPNSQLLIGGTGALEKDLRRQVKELQLQDRVSLHGWVEDTAAFLQQADIFVLPSRDEPFGIVLLEAMAQGLPIVSSRTSGPMEILDDATAWFAETGKSQSLANAMLNSVEDYALSEQKAMHANQRYAERYHIEQVVPQICDYYEELASRPL